MKPDLPEVLRAPPWRRRKERTEPIVELPMLDLPVRVAPELRDEWATKIDWVPEHAVVSQKVALAVAHGWAKDDDRREASAAWLLRFPEIAAVGLVPSALRDPSVARTTAGRALRWLVSRGGETADKTRRGVERYGSDVAAAIDEVLAVEPRWVCPWNAPKLPGWLLAGALPPVLLRSNEPVASVAVKHLLEMSTFADIEMPYVGFEEVKAACEPTSLDAFAWALFGQWLEAGAKVGSAGPWPMWALGLLGGAGCARRLGKLVRRWPAERAHQRAEAGARALALMGNDVALSQLLLTAHKGRYDPLKKRASALLDVVADERGMSSDELRDRIVPDLGLDADGKLRLDFGGRTFVVDLDERLCPVVRSGSGERLDRLPRGRKTDDPESVERAKARYADLRSDVKVVADGQLRRFENAMVRRRAWTSKDFEQLAKHPLLVHVVRGLVWRLRWQGDSWQFRVAEDRTLADVDDEELSVPEGATIDIPHPLELASEAIARWSERLAEYELVQPFEQLGRAVFPIATEERTAVELARYRAARFDTRRLFALEHRGYRRMAEGPTVAQLRKQLPVGVAVLSFGPGFDARDIDDTPEQTLSPLVVLRGKRYADKVPFGELDPIVFSELVRDVDSLLA